MDITKIQGIKMKTILRQISRYQGYIFARYVTLFLLLLTIIYFAFLSSPIYSCYILIIAVPAPYISRQIFYSFIQNKFKKSQTDVFTMVKRKYNFSLANYFSQITSFFITNFFIILWQTTLVRNDQLPSIHIIIPSIIFSIGIFSQVTFSFYFRIKLHICLMNNKW